MLKITTFMSMQPVSHVFSIVLLTKVLMKVQMPYRLSRMKWSYYVTQNGAGTSDGSSLENASCAMELQRVLNAAGERAKTGMDAIVKLAGYESASLFITQIH